MKELIEHHKEPLKPREQYTYLVQLLIQAYNDGKLPGVVGITVEPDYGYVAAIEYDSGERRIIYGHDPGFNPGTSEELAKDKGYTKFMLRENDIRCAKGSEFLLPWWAETLRQSDRQQYNDEIRDTNMAEGYIQENLTYPVFIKPSRGSQGVGVAKIENPDELRRIFETYDQERIKVALVEENLSMPDYRILVFDGEVVNAYERQPLAVIGDGKSEIGQLINARHSSLMEAGRDIHMERQEPLIMEKLGKLGLLITDIIPEGQEVRLLDISNLSAGGTAVDVGETIHQHWRDLAISVAKIFNLRVCGIDLACRDITSADSDYAVIEVNATPGAKQFMASGEAQREKLEALFLSFFSRP